MPLQIMQLNQSGEYMSTGDEKAKAVDVAMTQIERQFGKGAIMRLGDRIKVDVDVISSGSVSLDAALGVGGVPRGRIVEIYGPESSGKTTLALHIVSEAQKTGGLAAFVDAEHALDPTYAKKLGVDTVNLLVSQPDSGEQASRNRGNPGAKRCDGCYCDRLCRCSCSQSRD